MTSVGQGVEGHFKPQTWRFYMERCIIETIYGAGLIPIMIDAIKELSARVKVLEGDHDS